MTEENGKKDLVPVRTGRLPAVSKEKAPLIKRAMRDVAEGILGQPASISRPMHRVGRFEFLSDDYQQILEWAPLFGFEEDLEGFAEYLDEGATNKNRRRQNWLYRGRILSMEFSGVKISNLPISFVPALQELWCQRTLITRLNLSGVPELVFLHCSSNQLTELDLSSVPELILLDCFDNKLTELDLSHVPKLDALYCGDNQLSELDLSHTPELEFLECAKNFQLNHLDLSRVPKLRRLFCMGNQMTELDLSKVPELEILYCAGNQFMEVDVRSAEDLRFLSLDPWVNVLKNSEQDIEIKRVGVGE